MAAAEQMLICIKEEAVSTSNGRFQIELDVINLIVNLRLAESLDAYIILCG